MDDTSNRFPRSGPTRARILAAAQRQFAEDGYEKVTIRSVAAEAGIDPSLVIRYFGTKDGLFAAAVVFDLRLPDLMKVPKRQIGRAVIEHFLDRWEGPQSSNDLPALLRAAVSNANALEHLHAIFREQVAPAVAKVCPAGQVERCAALMASQILGLAYGRYVLRLPSIVALDRETLIEQVGPTLQRYIRG